MFRFPPKGNRETDLNPPKQRKTQRWSIASHVNDPDIEQQLNYRQEAGKSGGCGITVSLGLVKVIIAKVSRSTSHNIPESHNLLYQDSRFMFCELWTVFRRVHRKHSVTGYWEILTA